MSLHGLTALVTGSGAGVGRGIAMALASAGAHVVVATRSETGWLSPRKSPRGATMRRGRDAM